MGLHINDNFRCSFSPEYINSFIQLLLYNCVVWCSLSCEAQVLNVWNEMKQGGEGGLYTSQVA